MTIIDFSLHNGSSSETTTNNNNSPLVFYAKYTDDDVERRQQHGTRLCSARASPRRLLLPPTAEIAIISVTAASIDDSLHSSAWLSPTSTSTSSTLSSSGSTPCSYRTSSPNNSTTATAQHNTSTSSIAGLNLSFSLSASSASSPSASTASSPPRTPPCCRECRQRKQQLQQVMSSTLKSRHVVSRLYKTISADDNDDTVSSVNDSDLSVSIGSESVEPDEPLLASTPTHQSTTSDSPTPSTAAALGAITATSTPVLVDQQSTTNVISSNYQLMNDAADDLLELRRRLFINENNSAAHVRPFDRQNIAIYQNWPVSGQEQECYASLEISSSLRTKCFSWPFGKMPLAFVRRYARKLKHLIR